MAEASPQTRCPICQAETRAGERYFPFCSPRCQLIDLGNWLGERYVVPGDREEETPPDEEEPER
jgi:hypothetical protein